MRAVQTATVVFVEEHNGIHSLWLAADGFSGTAGQFVNVYLPDAARLLPRPISICEHDGLNLRLVFQVAGGGTEMLSRLTDGAHIGILGGLGNGYEVAQGGPHILVGGGIGIPPLIELAAQIRRTQPEAEIHAFLGGRTRGFLEYLATDFKKHGAAVSFATDDGSLGYSGSVLGLMKSAGVSGAVYACGPKPMLRAVAEYDGEAQVSVEERMACGLGACVGCVCKAGGEYKKVCKDGPVFRGSEVDWDA